MSRNTSLPSFWRRTDGYLCLVLLLASSFMLLAACRGAEPLPPTPTQTMTPTRTPVPTFTPTHTPTPTPAPTYTPTSTPTPVVAPALDSSQDTAHQIGALINAERAKHALSPLAYNDTLSLAAQHHAQDCAQRGYGSHVGSDGATLRQRLARVGYTGSWMTESWAWARSPQHAVAMWLNETPPDDPHRRMLLSPKLTEIGVGVAKGSWGYYFIADFGRHD
ncbi:MAG: hypothetical protein DSY55_06040 [Clostridia bacterium]|nr:MAG: hypothetical protein DSY55_06040 [Clostridia bacterium]